MASATFSGNGNYRLDLTVGVNGQTIDATIGVCRTAGSGYWTNANQNWKIRISGYDQSGTWKYDFRNGVTCIGIATRSRGVGYGTFLVEAWVNMDSGIGQAYASQYVTIAAAPNAPVNGSVDQITTTSMRYQFAGNGDNGSGIIEYEAQYSTDPNFNGAQTINTGTGGVANAGNLQSATTYYWRSRARNGVGWSGWSGTSQGTTLPAGPPGITVTPSGDGQKAQVQLTPPGNTSGVTGYILEYGPQGGSTQQISVGNSYVVTGLTPGATYGYRALAQYSSQNSPWSSWVNVQQTSPVADPNAYFDGSMGGAGTRLFFWEGTPHASRSIAREQWPVGWQAGSPTGAALLSQSAGGVSGNYSARLTILSAPTQPGVFLGPFYSSGVADIIPGVPYVGSIYARPSKTRWLRAVLRWYTAGLQLISEVVGDNKSLTPAAYQRLTVQGTAPDNAAFATVIVTDRVTWTPWDVDDFLDADAASITMHSLYEYFDGSTPDTLDLTYSWEGDPNSSVSLREIQPATTFTLLDPDCAAIPNAPRPPAITNDCVVLVGQWRRFWGVIPAAEVSEWMDILPTITLQSQGADASQVRIRYYRNPDGLVPEQFDASDWEFEQILSYMPANATVVLDGISESATATVGGRENVPADHLLYGTRGGVVTWPVLTCGTHYLISWDIPLDLPIGDLSMSLELTQRY